MRHCTILLLAGLTEDAVPAWTRSSATTKRVRIASPPVPISPQTPASYVSSPGETRYVNFPASPQPPDSGNLPYAQALASNPFQASSSSSDGERDDVDEELLENTRQNSALGSPNQRDTGNGTAGSAVQATLARFAGVPRRSTAPPTSGSGEQKGGGSSSSKSSRPALDFDAFKRLLLTGEPGVTAEQAIPTSTSATSPLPVHSDSSSSNTDTASVSQHAIFEPPPTVITDTPRTSHEFDREDAVSERGVVLVEATTDKKPPVPKPRHGKAPGDSSSSLPLPINHGPTRTRHRTDGPTAANHPIPSLSDLNKALPPAPIDNSFPPAVEPGVSDTLQAHASLRRPPTPPLTRRRSQRRSQSMPESYNVSPKVLSEAVAGTTSSPDLETPTVASKAPPPPPSRRQKRASDIGLQSLGATVQVQEEEEEEEKVEEEEVEEEEGGGGEEEEGEEVEEEDIYMTSTQPQLSPSSSMTSLSQSKPQPPPSRNPSAAKRLSRLSTGSPTMAPPVPPPRRVRGSSRSSFDSQVAVLNPGPSNESRRPSTESSWNPSGPSTSKDILADLAALQMEVDSLKSKQGA